MLQQIYQWLTLRDYTVAKDEATLKVIKRYTRNNVSLQNGWYLDEDDLTDLSKKGDRAMTRLQKRVARLRH